MVTQAQLATSLREPIKEDVIAAVQNDTQCYGCVNGDVKFDKFCDSVCLTPCEFDLLTKREMGPDAFQGEVRHSMI